MMGLEQGLWYAYRHIVVRNPFAALSSRLRAYKDMPLLEHAPCHAVLLSEHIASIDNVPASWRKLQRIVSDERVAVILILPADTPQNV